MNTGEVAIMGDHTLGTPRREPFLYTHNTSADSDSPVTWTRPLVPVQRSAFGKRVALRVVAVAVSLAALGSAVVLAQDAVRSLVLPAGTPPTSTAPHASTTPTAPVRGYLDPTTEARRTTAPVTAARRPATAAPIPTIAPTTVPTTPATPIPTTTPPVTTPITTKPGRTPDSEPPTTPPNPTTGNGGPIN